MNPRSLALIASLSALAAFQARAQSNVSIYGIVDAYAQYLDGTSRTARLQSGGMSGSRLGFRGTEDLGDGFKAIFALEMGLNLDTGTSGQGGVAFGRQAFVGLADPAWGELTLGRQYGSLYWLAQNFNPFRTGMSGPSVYTIGGFAGGYEPFRGAGATEIPPAAGATGNGGPTRINNSIRYASPVWNGLSGTAILGLGEVAGGAKDNRLYDLSIRYSSDPFDAYILYVSDKTSSATIQSDVGTLGFGGTYKFDQFKFYAGGIAVNDKRPSDEDGRGYWVGAEYAWSRNTVRAQWLQNRPRYGTENRTNAFGVGYQYDLSKRTAVYSSITRFRNDANAGAGGLGRYSSAIPSGLTKTGDNSLTEFVAGMRHTF
jgi:predicted porin